jgi:hypothetical protein
MQMNVRQQPGAPPGAPRQERARHVEGHTIEMEATERAEAWIRRLAAAA